MYKDYREARTAFFGPAVRRDGLKHDIKYHELERAETRLDAALDVLGVEFRAIAPVLNSILRYEVKKRRQNKVLRIFGRYWCLLGKKENRDCFVKHIIEMEDARRNTSSLTDES